MPKQAKVVLGGRTYTLTEKPMGRMLAWREKLRASRPMLIFQSLNDTLDGLRAVVQQAGKEGWRSVDDGDWLQLVQVLPTIANGLLYSVDDVWEMVFEFSTDMRKDRAWLEEHAYDSEGMAAFMEVLKLNFPITALWGLVDGSRAQQTSTNSVSPNGVSGLPASGPVPTVVSTS